MSRVNQLSITAHIFDNTGSIYLRTEDVIIPLPALFIPCNSPRADIDIRTKIVYGHDSGFVEEIYVEETIDELDELVDAGRGGGYSEEWLLLTGEWDDNGRWADDAVWID